MNKVTKINVLGFTKFQTIMGALIGLIAGIIYSFGGLIIDILVTIEWVSAEAASTSGLSFGTVLAFGALIGMPIIFAVFGFVLGIFESILFNLVAKWIGRIDLDFRKIK